MPGMPAAVLRLTGNTGPTGVTPSNGLRKVPPGIPGVTKGNAESAQGRDQLPQLVVGARSRKQDDGVARIDDPEIAVHGFYRMQEKGSRSGCVESGRE